MGQRGKAIGLVLLGASSFGFMSIVIKKTYEQGFSAAQVLGMQTVAGALLLLILTTVFRKWQRLNRKQLLQLMFAGALASTTSIFFQTALEYLPASITIVLLFQFTWIGVLLEAILERKWPGLEKWMSLGLLGIGTVLASDILGTGLTGLSTIGIVCGLLSAVTYSGTMTATSRFAVTVNPLMRSLVMSASSFALIWSLFRPDVFSQQAMEGHLWLWGLVVSCFSILLPNLCFTYGIPKIGPGLATILGAVELPATVLLSFVLLKESVTTEQFLGNLIILLGVAVSQWQGRRKKVKPSLEAMPPA